MLEWLALAGCAAEPLRPAFDGRDAARGRLGVVLRPVVSGVPEPTDVIPVPGHPDRLVVLSKSGTAWLAPVGGPAARWFEVPVRTDSELGLLSLAFAPDFATSGTFVVHLDPADGALRSALVRGHVDPVTLAGPALGEVLFEVPQPQSNHDGGTVAFGPDGALYWGLGDGGGQGDPDRTAQDRGSLLGKILRLTVPPAGPAAALPDNPFASRPGARPEIWALGLRNPWRFSFDPSGRMLVGDVGQDRWEEIDWVQAGDDLGWSVREADRCFRTERCAPSVAPLWSYGHDEGISVTGGVTATAGPLAGRYVFGDFGSGRLWALSVPPERTRVAEVTALGRFDVHPSAFARAPDGGVWLADHVGGAIYAIAPE